MSKEKDAMLVNKITSYNRLISKIRTGNINKGQAQPSNKDLNYGSKLRAARRLAPNWETLSTNNVSCGYTPHFYKMKGRRSDMMSYPQFTKDNDLMLTRESSHPRTLAARRFCKVMR